MKRILITLILVTFLLINISATQQTFGTFKINEEINLIQTCSNCTNNNITAIISPNSTKLIENVEMTRDGTFYNYTFSDTSETGEYIVNGIGDLDGIVTIWSYNLFVTKTGDQLETSDSIIYLISLVFIFIIFAVTLGFGLWINWKDERNEENGKLISINRFRSIKIILLVLAYYQFYFILHILIQISDSFLNLNLTFDFLKIMHTIYAATLWPFAILFVGFFTINLVFDYKKQDFLRKGGKR